ncbi:MAG: peptidoglycan-binding protein [Candidatus Nomurabacteria bacterium]|nr:MAG: peptidoglycan-binding protein [Candidatus Nomurabacteria bacterium]
MTYKSYKKYLNSQGFILVTTGPGSPGQETQKFGAATRNALIRYQEQNNIQPAIGYFK